MWGGNRPGNDDVCVCVCECDTFLPNTRTNKVMLTHTNGQNTIILNNQWKLRMVFLHIRSVDCAAKMNLRAPILRFLVYWHYILYKYVCVVYVYKQSKITQWPQTNQEDFLKFNAKRIRIWKSCQRRWNGKETPRTRHKRTNRTERTNERSKTKQRKLFYLHFCSAYRVCVVCMWSKWLWCI